MHGSRLLVTLCSAAVALLPSCSKPPASTAAQQAQAERDQARKEAAALSEENAKLKAEVARLGQQVHELSITDEGLWSTALQQRERGGEAGLGEARKTLAQLVERFPSSPRGKDARQALAGVDRELCTLHIAALSAGGAPTDRKTAEVEAASMPALTRECSTAAKGVAKQLAARQKLLRDLLAKWPASMTVQEFKDHYRQEIGQRALLKGTLTATAYYNYGYSDARRLRSFTLESEDFGGLYLYCAKAEAWCTTLFASLQDGTTLSATVVVENSRRHYQADTSDMALLVSVERRAE